MHSTNQTVSRRCDNRGAVLKFSANARPLSPANEAELTSRTNSYQQIGLHSRGQNFGQLSPAEVAQSISEFAPIRSGGFIIRVAPVVCLAGQPASRLSPPAAAAAPPAEPLQRPAGSCKAIYCACAPHSCALLAPQNPLSLALAPQTRATLVPENGNQELINYAARYKRLPPSRPRGSIELWAGQSSSKTIQSDGWRPS